MSLLFSKTGVALVAFLLLGGYLLWTEHQEHLAALGRYWPLLLILFCPLIHLFMHRHGHGGHGAANAAADESVQKRTDREDGEARDA